jgi:threonine/homoserine/homoserine lactone efflux protein
MIISLVAGVIAGFVLALPPGPVGVTAIKLALDKGSRHALLAALGTTVMDFIFCFIAVFATSAIITLVDKFAAEFPLGVLLVQITVVVAIIAYGILLRKNKNDSINEIETVKTYKFIDYLKSRGPFLLGFAVALANVANPTFLGSISYVSMLLQKWAFIDSSVLGRTIYSFGFAAGTFLWLYLLVKIIIFYKPRMSEDMIFKIKRFAGLTLIGFGTILGYRVIAFTKWGEILRLVFAF